MSKDELYKIFINGIHNLKINAIQKPSRTSVSYMNSPLKTSQNLQSVTTTMTTYIKKRRTGVSQRFQNYWVSYTTNLKKTKNPKRFAFTKNYCN